MSDWRKIYWQGFNFVGKIVGVLFILFGTIFIVYGATSNGAAFVITGLIVAVLGILLVCARPSRSDRRE
jgi:membrane-bound ClpP family serine protease